MRPPARPASDALSPATRWRELLGRAPADVRATLAQRATLRARELGLAVVRPQGDMDIPLSLTPEVIERSTTQARASDARHVLTAVVKAARAVLSPGVDGPWARQLFGHFGPLEAACLRRWREAEDVTIARVDWFLDGAGRHRALELNATIPAMEAYSDAAAQAWIEKLGAFAGLEAGAIQRLVAAHGSNAEELRRSIVAHSGRGPEERPSIAIIHREADAQLRELESLTRRFRAAGHEVRLAVAREVKLQPDGRVTIGSFEPDVLYRHIFARRMEPGSDLERIARGEARKELQNRVNGQFEVKGLLAELHRVVTEQDGAGLHLSETEIATVRTVVPWTRLLARGAGMGPNGERVSDLGDLVMSDPAHLVLKKSWDYGGKSVLLGPDVLAAEGAAGWERRVREALAEGPGSWVVQSLVASPRQKHLVVQDGRDAAWEDVFVDASTFTATGNDAVPGGGVVRFARTGVVNIVGGGGVAPLIDASVAEQLADAAEHALPRPD